MARTILKTIPLTDLVWSGNDKKTANVPAGSDFEFYPRVLPTFTEQYDKPEEFTIYYRDEFSVMQPLTCNYVSNGATRYTFSYKLDNDVINLSVFKSDGHLEINVRNAKLDIPMNLNQVEFQVQWRGQSFDAPDYWVDPEEAGTITGPEVVYEGEEVVVEVLINEGYQIISTSYYVDEKDGMQWDGELEKIDDTHYSFTMPRPDYPFIRVEVYVYCEEIPVVEYSITISETEHGTVVADKEKAVAGELITLTITPDEGYEIDEIEVKDGDGNVISTSTTFNLPASNVTVLVTFKETPVPPTPGEGDLIFTTTFNRYAIVDVLVKEDGSAGVVNVRRLTDDDVDLDDTYETVLRAACTFRQDLIVGVEVEMNKPDNVAANYTVKNTKIFINGEEI